jgi:hypothetical protein
MLNLSFWVFSDKCIKFTTDNQSPIGHQSDMADWWPIGDWLIYNIRFYIKVKKLELYSCKASQIILNLSFWVSSDKYIKFTTDNQSPIGHQSDIADWWPIGNWLIVKLM